MEQKKKKSPAAPEHHIQVKIYWWTLCPLQKISESATGGKNLYDIEQILDLGSFYD